MMQRFAALALSLFLAATAHAAAPQIIPLQGVLTDASGTPISTAVVVQFYLYPAQTGGSALWTETQTITPQDGLFVAYLGSQT
ncbi:MAG: collagen-like protein, partial [Deltaproteobacteria bacterium]|nr:collagen-like protein [Deltaproteobacteria bacterium]